MKSLNGKKIIMLKTNMVLYSKRLNTKRKEKNFKDLPLKIELQ